MVGGEAALPVIYFIKVSKVRKKALALRASEGSPRVKIL